MVFRPQTRSQVRQREIRNNNIVAQWQATITWLTERIQTLTNQIYNMEQFYIQEGRNETPYLIIDRRDRYQRALNQVLITPTIYPREHGNNR